jgi:peptide/nickel transport system substrate-binding protein
MEVPRNRTLITSFQGVEGKWVAPELWNPYAIGTTHQDGLNVIYEPLAFYSAFADEEILWLAESYSFNDDFTELTIKTRSGINWSDGEPFSAEDVAYTIDTLRQLGAEVMWGTEMATFVESAEATDANTCVIKFKVPSARLFYFMSYKYDIGVPMVPKHIFEGKEWSTFGNLDIEKGWPVSTGPWKVVESTPEQRVYEPIEPREEWWAYKQGLAPQPMQIDRWVYIPRILDYTIGVETMVANEIDWLLFDDPLPAKRATEESPTIMTHSGKDSPYGYEDWWPLSVWINNTVEPYDQTDVRWALSYYTDREAVVEVGQAGIGWPHPVPMPDYPGLRKYVDGIEDILEDMNPIEYNPEKAEALLTGAGFSQDGDGNWMKPDGSPFTVLIEGWPGAAGRGTVIAELWSRVGIQTEYAQPPDAWARYTQGDYEMFIAGHGGSIAKDPYDTLKLYQSRSTAIPGIHAVNFNKWAEHPEYDALVDEMWTTDPDDIDTIIDIWRRAYTIWLTDLPEVLLGAFFHHIIYNERYWKGWPTKDDPYINEAIQHFTWQLVLNRLTPTE